MYLERFLLSTKFTMADGFSILGIVLLLVVSAFLSANEMAFSSVNTMRIKSLADENAKGARKAQYICDHYDFALVCVLVGNNLVNIANTTICAYFFSKFILNATISNLVNTVVMTIVILIFGEILPKSYAKSNPEKFVLKFGGGLYVCMKILYIIAWPFYKFQGLFVKNKEEARITENEFETIVDTMENQGTIDSENADIIHGALDLSEKTVYDILVPRVDMLALALDSSLDEIKQAFTSYHYSRIPIYDGDKDNIIGILNYKDFFALNYNGNDFKLENLLSEPLKVTETMKVDDLIKIMQKEKKHMAIVVDEYGGTSGIVTLEDALELMLGEIYDEHDEAEDAPIQKLEENKYSVDPDISIEDLFDYLGIEHLPETKYSSVGGMIYELSETMPKKGTVVKITAKDDILDENSNYITITTYLTFEVVNFDDDRIQKLNLTVSREESEAED